MTEQGAKMTQYRKKSIVVEAQQWFPGVEIEGVITDPKALVGVPGATMAHQSELEGGDTGVIKTPEGLVYISSGDWIITNAAGEKHPCHPELFVAHYEAVE